MVNLNACGICFSDVVLISPIHLDYLKIINRTFKNTFKWAQSSVINLINKNRILSVLSFSAGS
jgi:hypothetical protein